LADQRPVHYAGSGKQDRDPTAGGSEKRAWNCLRTAADILSVLVSKLFLVKPCFLSYNKRAAAYGGLFVQLTE
ncbi:hypothetical protein DXB25_26320, partial [Lachnospiraceae bacterium OM02-31]